MRYFEDFQPGDVIDLGSVTVTAEDIVRFARQFDPAPYHLDEAAGAASPLGGLAASGWHLCALSMQMICRSFLLESSSQGAPGVDECRWLKPVLAGETLSGRMLVREARRMRSRPEVGLVHVTVELIRSDGELAVSLTYPGMFRAREAA